jgi:hypothetical protein
MFTKTLLCLATVAIAATATPIEREYRIWQQSAPILLRVLHLHIAPSGLTLTSLPGIQAVTGTTTVGALSLLPLPLLLRQVPATPPRPPNLVLVSPPSPQRPILPQPLPRLPLLLPRPQPRPRHPRVPRRESSRHVFRFERLEADRRSAIRLIQRWLCDLLPAGMSLMPPYVFEHF